MKQNYWIQRVVTLRGLKAWNDSHGKLSLFLYAYLIFFFLHKKVDGLQRALMSILLYILFVHCIIAPNTLLWAGQKGRALHKLDWVSPLITDPPPTSSTILSENYSCLALMVWEWSCFENIFQRITELSQLMSNKGVCRTAPASLK